MRAGDILSTIVELSVSVTGFSGVVAALAPNRPGEWPALAQTLFSALLLTAAATASLCLIAMVLLSSLPSPHTAWVIVSALHGLFLVGVLALQIRQPRFSGESIPPLLFVPVAGIPLLALAQLANASVFRTTWICIASLSVHALIGFVFFIALVQPYWRISPAAQQTSNGTWNSALQSGDVP